MKDRTFYRKLAALALPLAFQGLMQSLVSASDAVMMGFIDQSSLAAVSLATRISFVVSLFIFGLTGGGSILAARRGKHRICAGCQGSGRGFCASGDGERRSGGGDRGL